MAQRTNKTSVWHRELIKQSKSVHLEKYHHLTASPDEIQQVIVWMGVI